jgi:hypothetical protein
MLSRNHPLLLVLAITLASSGCTQHLGRPQWGNPGTTEAQRQRANLFDPYADNDLGPEVVGARPRGFQKPRAEAARTPLLRDTMWGI